MAGYALAIFLSSFLLFQMQPMIGKYILPWFGGTPGVWTTCMLTFQLLLLVGYGYAHWLAERLTLRRQGLLHLALLAVSLLFLPIILSDAWKPVGGASPVLRILGLLAVSVGAPYLLLSSTAPLLQSWYSRTHRDRSPYRLYALSNFGALLALVSYPFVFEPALTLGHQAWIWSFCYGVFALVCGGCAYHVCRAGRLKTVAATAEDEIDVTVPSWADSFLWLVLAACGSVLLLATTNQMCQEVAVVPFLWVLPLALYLTTFILCFDSPRWYRRYWFGPLLAAAIVVVTGLWAAGLAAPLWVQVVGHSAVLFVGCMVCHGELAAMKPHPKYLTRFYLMVAAGGALGGVMVSVVAPLLFTAYWEYPLGLAVCCALFLTGVWRDPSGWLYRGRPRWAWVALIAMFAGLTGSLGYEVVRESRHAVAQTRNFYGVLRVIPKLISKNGYAYVLRHGRTTHGLQFLNGGPNRWPTSYFGLESGVGLALRNHPRRGDDGEGNLRVGVIGLGVGTLAVYGKSGDVMRLYEINPDVVRLAERYFTYLKDSPAEIDVILGDGRISLERSLCSMGSEQFDVLVVDAFSSDAVPMHLLTRECYDLYWRHLKPDGILVMQITNRHVDLGPVVRGAANESGHEAVLVITHGDGDKGLYAAHWVLVTANRRFLENAAVVAGRTSWPADAPQPLVWKDDYCNLFEVLSD